MSEEPRKVLDTADLARAIQTRRLVLGSATGPRWRSWPAVPESVRLARRFASGVLAEVAASDADHVDDVVLAVSELITNAVNAVREATTSDPARANECPIRLGIAALPRWTHLLAVDTAPALPREAHRGPLAGSGRGIPIINNLAAVTWAEQGSNDKTLHVVVTRTGVELTAEDREALSSNLLS